MSLSDASSHSLASSWKHFGAILGSSVFSTICIFFSSIITARWLGPAGQGTLASMLVYPLLASAAANFGIRQAVARAVGQREQPIEVVAGTLCLALALTGSIGVTILLVTARAGESTTVGAIIMAAFLMPLMCVQSYASGFFIGLKCMRSYINLRWIPSALQIASAAIVPALAQPSLNAGLAIYFIPNIVAALIAGWLFVRIGPSPKRYRLDNNYFRKIFSEGMSYGLAITVSSCSHRVGVLMLGQYSTREQVGIFSIADQTAQMVWQLPAAFGILVFADAVSGKASSRSDAFRSIRYCLWASAAIALIACTLGPFAVPYIFGIAYAPSVECFMALIPGIAAMMTYKIGNFELMGHGRPWIGMTAMISGLIVNVVAGYFLIPRLGALGAAIAAGFGYTLSGIVFLYTYSKLAMAEASEIDHAIAN